MRRPLAMALVLAAAPTATLAQSSSQAPGPMEDLFARKCASCHTVGKGQRVGPDLKGVHERRDRSWLEHFVKAPSTMLDTDPEARKLVAPFGGVRMPDLGLSAGEVKGLVELIIRCSAQPCDLAGKFVPVTTATEADVARGRDLFLGRLPQRAGGAPCLSCHTVRGAGTAVPGGTLAKDLTNVFARLGDEGLDAGLRSPTFPLMNKVFADHPLASEEVFALRAFLYQANRAEPAPEETLSPVLVAGLGTLAVLGVLNAAWARRLRGVRMPLLKRTR